MALSDPLSPSLLAALAGFVTARFGLRCLERNWDDLGQAISEITEELGLESPVNCARWLLAGASGARPLEILARHLTIGESHFFREPASFDRLRQRIIPDLVKARRARRRLRIWSAGCSTGEEPYSIAMLLQELLPAPGDWDIAIWGTDINVDALSLAERGVYRGWSFRGVADGVRDRFFAPCGDGLFELDPRIRRQVRFRPLNLVAEPYPAPFGGPEPFDLILCRNVLMYFEPGHARQTAQRLTGRLRDDGWLMLGAAEAPQLVGPGRVSVAPVAPPAPPPAVTPQPRPQPVKPALPTAADRYRVAFDLYRRRRYEAAAAIANEILAAEPGSAKALALLARIDADNGALDTALDWSRRAIAADKIDPSLHYLHAVILNEIGERAAAAAALQRTIYLAPDFVLAHYLLGMLARGEGNRRATKRHLDNALSILARRPSDDPVDEEGRLSAASLIDIIRATLVPATEALQEFGV